MKTIKKLIFSFLLVIMIQSCINVRTNLNDVKVIEQTDHNAAETEILNVMQAQEKAWNNGDLVGFMQGYWKSDSLKFYGSNGLTKGWQNTLDNYKKGYPTKAETGKLRFVINDVSNIEGNNYWVMGEYHLTRDVGDANGVFIIIFKKIDGQWKIVADMSC